MTEEQQTTKNMTIKIDTVALEERLKSQYEDQIKAKDETIKALLSQEKERLMNEKERKQAEYINSPKPAPIGGTTADYSSNLQRTTFPIDIARSDLELFWIKGRTPEEAIKLTQELANQGNMGCKKVIDRLTKKVVKNGINMEFRGSSKDFLRSPLPINDSLPVEEQQRRKKINDRLRANRTQWVNLDSED